MNEERSDVTFVVDGQRLPAFKALLSLRSPVFEELFNEDPNQKEIVVTDATVDGFKTMLSFIYIQELAFTEEINVDLVLDVYNLSNKYQLKRLTECLDKYIEKFVINCDNINDIYTFAIDNDHKSLSELAINFMRRNTTKLLNKDMKQLIALNRKSGNSLFAMIARKLKNIESILSTIKHYGDRQGRVDGYPCYYYYTCPIPENSTGTSSIPPCFANLLDSIYANKVMEDKKEDEEEKGEDGVVVSVNE